MNKHLTITIAAAALVAGMSQVALAQSATTSTPTGVRTFINVREDGNAHLGGAITTISGTTLNVSSWFGTYSVDASNAKLQRRYGGTSSISEFQVGDTVDVVGMASQNGQSINASRVQDMTIYDRGVHPTGIISNIASSSSNFTLTTGGDNPQTFQVTANASTKIRVSGIGQASFPDLANGMTVQVWGTLDRNGKTIIANAINARMQKAHPNRSRKSRHSRGHDNDDSNMQTNTSLQTGLGGVSAGVSAGASTTLGH